MAQRSAIQLRPLQPPPGQEAVHQLVEPVIVVAFQQMRHLMDDDVLQARNLLLGQFQIHPDAARFNVEVAR